MECEICDIIKGKRPELILYEDERTIAFLSDKPLVKNHIIIAPKEHYTQIEQISKEMIIHFYYVASFASTAVYELLGGGQDLGTNIILNEGKGSDRREEHIVLDVLPRKNEDGLNLRWEPKPADQSALDEVMGKIKDETFFIGKRDSSDETKDPSQEPLPKDKKVEKLNNENNENYMIRQLNRIP